MVGLSDYGFWHDARGLVTLIIIGFSLLCEIMILAQPCDAWVQDQIDAVTQGIVSFLSLVVCRNSWRVILYRSLECVVVS